ncbi:PASTA domain-containing protein [Blattabacterium cuenoti]|uniref:PASTA domain-containing protein n=1 Tax=Blattabacterium cuenoti TaxID=1653831 RepID=UPI00163C2CF0|nr:PASTA domain-containing protein [Blattabacterium cuenoti]
MNYSKYILIFIFNLLAAIFILYKITQFALKWVDVYTKHGSHVEVPELRYMTLTESILILKKLGLKYNIDKSYYDPSLDNDKIISFFPKVGSHVKQGRFIYMKINSKPNKYCNVLPDIFNKKKNIAIKLLHKNNLFIKEIRYIEDDDIYKDKIIKVFYNNQSITSGYVFCKKNDGITLLIGKSFHNNHNIVPNVTGMPIKIAISILKNKFFNTVNFYYDYQNTNDHNAKVYRQKPDPGTIYDKNKPIDLWLSLEEPTTPPLPIGNNNPVINTPLDKKPVKTTILKKKSKNERNKNKNHS